MRTSEFIYVLMASVESRRIPVAVYDNRSRCENAIEEELEEELKAYGLRLLDCDHFTVEQWQVNQFLSGESVKTLTSYDRYGALAKRLVPLGREGQTNLDEQGNRFKKLLDT